MTAFREDARVDQSVLVVGFNSSLFGLEAASGRRLWELRLAPGRQAVEVVVRRGHVFASSARRLFCVERGTGAVVWSLQTPLDWGGRPSMVLQDGRIFLGAGGEVVCYDLEGALLWHESFEGVGVASVALAFEGNARPADETRR